MVSIGTHKLFLSVAGPDREAIVVLMQGLGSTIDEWVAVRRLVTSFARFLNYDRSGMGRSESPSEAPDAISAVSVATELDTLLKTANIAPPYVIVCHSWGGITSREFLHLRPKDIVGMVFVDANQEKTFDGGNWASPYVKAVNGSCDYLEVTGLSSDHKLSKEEWVAVVEGKKKPGHQATEAAEMKGYKGDPLVLAAKRHFEKQPLGNHPVSVIRANTARDFQRLHDAGVAAGNGSEEDRALYRELMARWDKKDHASAEGILRLSSLGRYQYTSENGHNIQLTDPELIVEEIKWVLDNLVEYLPVS